MRPRSTSRSSLLGSRAASSMRLRSARIRVGTRPSSTSTRPARRSLRCCGWRRRGSRSRSRVPATICAACSERRRMRSVLVCVVPALVVTASWLRLEEPQRWPRTLALVALALVPSLAPRAWQRVAALTIATVAAADLATRASVRHPLHLAGYAARHFWRGLNDFYAVRLPFDPSFRPDMHLVLLAAAFGFVAALGLAARRPVAAVFVVLVGAGWPATLLGGHDLLRGAAILGAALLLLSGFRGRAVVAGVALAGLALAAATQPAVARDELLHWQRWNIARHVPTVGVRYVWDAQYDGFTWPRKVTTVFVVKAPPTSVYWRATVLDAFDGTRWHERLQPAHPAFLSGKLDVTQGDALYPPAAGDPARWRQSEFDIRALADDHVVTPSGVAAYGAVPHDPSFARGGIATVQGGLQRGDDYTVWSYEPQPTPRQLARTPAVYPRAIAHDLQLPNPEHAFAVVAHKIAGDAQTPYGAALALESWFRSTGGFTYTQHPPKAAHTLAGFLRVKAGYCQHFAGAMAVMLRTLGVPARVAEGFVSGTYDPSTQTWTVTDHDAHAWVEAWFAGYGWLPFDPTPGRGSLSAPYSRSEERRVG